MSKEYREYLFKHKVFVCVGYYFLENLYSPNSSGRTKFHRDLCINQLFQHDKSKMSMTEYGPYDRYFYSKDELDEEAISKYKYAWNNHIHENPHHWQYWVLINDDDGEEALPMPRRYILELLCDWMSFDIIYIEPDFTSIEPYGTFKLNAHKLKKYWTDHENTMILHPSTRSSIKYMINKLEKTYGENGTIYIEPEVLENICKIIQREIKIFYPKKLSIEEVGKQNNGK